LQCAFKYINAERWHAVTSLAELPRGELREHGELFFGEVHACDKSLLCSACPLWNLLSELEYGCKTVIALFPQAQNRAVDVVVSDPPDSDYIRVTWELIEEEPPFALNPGVFVMWLHLNILAKSRGRGK
jgi:hypothetical protein